MLYVPLCLVLQQGPAYKDGPGPLLAGSVLTLLLLSKNPSLTTIGYQLAFTMNRMALAATQTTSFTDCVGVTQPLAPIGPFVPTYQGSLPKFTGDVPVNSGIGVPKNSGPYGAFNGPQAQAVYPITPDGIRTLCAAIASVSGPSNWLPNLLWQGLADTANAVRDTVDKSNLGTTPQPGVYISCAQARSLCGFYAAIYSFTTYKPPTNPLQVVVTVPGATVPGAPNDFTCMTTSAGCTTLPSGWQFTSSPSLDPLHAIGAPAQWCSCTP